MQSFKQRGGGREGSMVSTECGIKITRLFYAWMALHCKLCSLHYTWSFHTLFVWWDSDNSMYTMTVHARVPCHHTHHWRQIERAKKQFTLDKLSGNCQNANANTACVWYAVIWYDIYQNMWWLEACRQQFSNDNFTATLLSKPQGTRWTDNK